MDLFMSLAPVLGLAAGGGIIAKALKQPALLGYVLAGAAISYFNLAADGPAKSVVDSMGQLGVTLLLFLVGLELPISELKQMGKVALIVGVGQIIFTGVFGFLIVRLLGFSQISAIYLSLALVFSSTIIIVKLLSEKKDLQTLYGKIALGTLLVQDFIAIGVLVMLSGFSQGQVTPLSWMWIVIKGVILVAMALILSNNLLPRALDWLGKSTELLFITAIAWCIGVAAIVASPYIGFGVEIGGFLAGLALANASEHLQIASRVRPLRDFFLTLFFVSLGANIHIGDLGQWFWVGLLLSAFVLIGKPLIVIIIMGITGYKKRTSFLTSLTMGQISEFSLIVMALAVRVGHVNSQVLTLTALVGIITMTLSTYMIKYSNWLYGVFAPLLSIFERKHLLEKSIESKNWSKHIILFGHNRTGRSLFPALTKLDRDLLVVDFNPEVIEKLKKQKIEAVFGDISDQEIYEEINVSKAELIVSTVSDVNDNLFLLSYLAKSKSHPVVIVTAQDEMEAKRLYRAGADYALVPHTLGGEYLAHIFNHHGLDKTYIKDHGKNHSLKLSVA